MPNPNLETIPNALQCIPAEDRDLWVKIGMGVHAELGDAGFEVFDKWSQTSPNYNYADTKATYQSFKSAPSKGGKPITIATVFDEAKRRGYKPNGGLKPHQPSPEEIAERQRREKSAHAEEAARRERAARLAANVWRNAVPVGNEHPYLVRKQIAPTPTLRECSIEQIESILGYRPHGKNRMLQGRCLVAPIMVDGGIVNVELIDETGEKSCIAGGRKSGGFWASGALPEGDGTGQTLGIGEGVATVLTPNQVMSWPGIATFSNTNLGHVAKVMRKRYASASLVILADLQKDTGESDRHAIEAAREAGGILAVPDFGPNRDPNHKDWNDLLVLRGPDEVRRQLDNVIRASVSTKSDGTDGTDGTANVINSLSVPSRKTSDGTDGTNLEKARVPGEKDRPCFKVFDIWVEFGGNTYKPGVWHFGKKQGRNADDSPTLTQQWVCSPLHVEAVTLDGQDNNFGRLLRFKNTVGRWRTWAMPMDLLRGQGDEMRGELLSQGVEINPAGKNLLSQYLQERPPTKRMRCATQVGWCGDSFVLPDVVIGPSRDEVIFQASERAHGGYVVGGTMEGWRSEIAARAVGNPVLTLAISCAFAGPLLSRCHAEGGGIHFVGDSSIGKTGNLFAAASVWGNKEFHRSWKATANGMEGMAALHNDNLLALDEISECDPREVGAIIYSLGNGMGKQRATRTGGARSITKWLCFVLSTGERSIETLMSEGGHRVKAGQSVRLLNVPIQRPYGCWDNLHDLANGTRFTDAIKTSAATHYGHAGRAFLERLTQDRRDFAEALERIKNLLAFSPDDAEGQDKRAATRFALIALAGELATEYGVTGWVEGEATAAAIEAYKLWRAHRGKGNDERRQILECVASFIERHGDSRFSNLTAPENTIIRDRAGWWTDTGQDERTYLFTNDGLREALKGFDFKRSLDVLEQQGALPPGDARGERARQYRVLGRKAKLYPIAPNKLGGNYES